jgi:RIP homotypic interaction motif
MGAMTAEVGRSGRMDTVTLIVTALAARAASALQDGASAAVKDAYARLTALVRKRFADRPRGELVLAEHHAAPQTWEAPLAAELSAAGAEGDADLVTAAQALMRLVDEAGSRSGKYLVAVRDSQGVQIGDHNTQTNTFGPRPA